MSELTDRVEQAVRPVRARPARKRRMGQELLAHLTAAYDEELARLGDDRLALNLALARLGEPDELTRELQATVPRLERVLYSPGPGLRRLDRLARHFRVTADAPSPRVAAWLSAAFAAEVFVMLLVLPLVQMADGRTWSEARVAWGPLALCTVHAFVSMFLGLGFGRAVAGRLTTASALRIVGYGAAVLLSGLAFVAGMSIVQSDNPLWEFILTPNRIIGMVTGGALLLALLAVLVRVLPAARAELVTEG